MLGALPERDMESGARRVHDRPMPRATRDDDRRAGAYLDAALLPVLIEHDSIFPEVTCTTSSASGCISQLGQVSS
jgi:hypothetical protein